MGAPKGNKYYLGRSVYGRTKEFQTPAQLWEAFQEYRNWCEENPWYKNEVIKGGDAAGEVVAVATARPLTLKGFAGYIGLTHRALDNYGSAESYKAYFPVFTRIQEEIYSQKFEGAAVGAFNANIIARDLGLVDKQDRSLTFSLADKIKEARERANQQ